jgi:ribosomal protein L7/L12
MEEQGPKTPSKEVVDLIISGQKIEAIKRFREASGAGLKDAKDAVERLEAELGEQHPQLQKSKAGCGTTSAVLLVATLGVLGFLVERIVS